MWLYAAIVGFGLFVRILGNLGLKKQEREKPKKWEHPSVSVVIPAYKSELVIEKCLKSVKAVKYKGKLDVVVINDSPDNTPRICKKFGVRCIQNKKRMGKARALNKAVKNTDGKVLFFVDSDTYVTPDVVERAVRWFGDRNVGAVMPKYAAANNRHMAKFVEIENRIMLSLVKMNLFFGTILGFRGCCVFVRRDVFEEIGGFNETLLEDNELSARIVKAGYRIRFEKKTGARTTEPETKNELKKQKFRWGKGALFCFIRHYRIYLKNWAFVLHFFPYFLIGIAAGLGFLAGIAGFLYGTGNVIWVIVGMLLYLLACVVHIYVIAGRKNMGLADVVAFVLYYFPTVSWYYFRGIVSGIAAKKKGERELALNDWV